MAVPIIYCNGHLEQPMWVCCYMFGNVLRILATLCILLKTMKWSTSSRILITWAPTRGLECKCFHIQTNIHLFMIPCLHNIVERQPSCLLTTKLSWNVQVFMTRPSCLRKTNLVVVRDFKCQTPDHMDTYTWHSRILLVLRKQLYHAGFHLVYMLKRVALLSSVLCSMQSRRPPIHMTPSTRVRGLYPRPTPTLSASSVRISRIWIYNLTPKKGCI